MSPTSSGSTPRGLVAADLVLMLDHRPLLVPALGAVLASLNIAPPRRRPRARSITESLLRPRHVDVDRGALEPRATTPAGCAPVSSDMWGISTRSTLGEPGELANLERRAPTLLPGREGGAHLIHVVGEPRGATAMDGTLQSAASSSARARPDPHRRHSSRSWLKTARGSGRLPRLVVSLTQYRVDPYCHVPPTPPTQAPSTASPSLLLNHQFPHSVRFASGLYKAPVDRHATTPRAGMVDRLAAVGASSASRRSTVLAGASTRTWRDTASAPGTPRNPELLSPTAASCGVVVVPIPSSGTRGKPPPLRIFYVLVQSAAPSRERDEVHMQPRRGARSTASRSSSRPTRGRASTACAITCAHRPPHFDVPARTRI